MKNLVYVLAATMFLSACTGTSQNPLSNHPKSQQLEPQEGPIEARGRDVEWKVKVEQRVDTVVQYVPRVVGEVQFFQVLAPTQFQFVVGKPTIVPIRVRGLYGQLKYDIAVESATLKQLKLENIQVDGNDTTADVMFTASSSDIPADSVVGLGNLTFKISLIDVKDADADLEKIYREKAKANGLQRIDYPYAILPSGSVAAAVTVPEAVKGDEK